ncbi:hypothetical protein PSHT_16233 [Puccinia striiformis]|uniref:Ig-like domain-containing protein n=1 Tax=Puccinia striiformis TaxID=27350 RepID=A0A2S4UAW4_9BASI|nr:hypothetical protein PSHT_16233 [Puccinia striiformis]
MVSFAHLFTLLSVLVSVALAEDAAAPKAEGVDEKFFYGGGYNRFLYGNNRITCGVGYTIPVAYPWINTYGPCSAYALFPGTTRLWFKEAGETASTARRSLAMKADQVFRRDTSTVSCKANNGQTDTFVVSDCLKAVDALVSKKVSSFSCNSCSAKLVSPQGAVVPAAGVPADALQKAAKSMLKACGGQASTVSNKHDILPHSARNLQKSDDAVSARFPANSQPTRRSPAETAHASDDHQAALIFQKGTGQSC